jgi:hypothetical protein
MADGSLGHAPATVHKRFTESVDNSVEKYRMLAALGRELE